MKAKSFLLNILFFILAITFVNCTSNTIEEDVVTEENLLIDLDKQMIDKEDIEEPDDRN